MREVFRPVRLAGARRALAHGDLPKGLEGAPVPGFLDGPAGLDDLGKVQGSEIERSAQGIAISPDEATIASRWGSGLDARHIGARRFAPNDDWAVQRSRCMAVETSNQASDDAAVSSADTTD
jgi:hypothetical protein